MADNRAASGAFDAGTPLPSDPRMNRAIIEIGDRYDLTANRAQKAAGHYIQLIRARPDMKVEFIITGYGDDPWHVAEVPEAISFLKAWADEVRRIDAASLLRLPIHCRLLIAVSDGNARVRHDHDGKRWLSADPAAFIDDNGGGPLEVRV